MDTFYSFYVPFTTITLERKQVKKVVKTQHDQNSQQSVLPTQAVVNKGMK